MNVIDLDDQTINGWYRVTDRLPEQRPSIFARFYGTNRWSRAMWRNESDRVLCAVRFPDGTRTVCTGNLHDGAWKVSVSEALRPVVTHWMPYPSLPPEDTVSGAAGDVLTHYLKDGDTHD